MGTAGGDDQRKPSVIVDPREHQEADWQERRRRRQQQQDEQQLLQRELLGAFLQNTDGRPYNNNHDGQQQQQHDDDWTTTTTTRAKLVPPSGGIVVVGGIIVGLLGLQFPFLFPKSAPYMATPGRKIRRALQFLNDNNTINMSNNHLYHYPNQNRTTATTTTTTTTKSLSIPSSSSSSASIRPQQQQQQRTFVDLGSGDGQAVYEAAKLGYTAIGIELNWALWGLSSIRRWLFWKREERNRSKLICQDFTHYDLSGADIVMIFAVPRTMPVLGRKIQAECKSGTTVLAYRFAIPLAQQQQGEGYEGKKTDRGIDDGDDVDDDDGTLLNADLIYDQEDMRIYRMKEKKSLP